MDRTFLRKSHFQGLRRVGVGGRHAHDSWYQIDAHLSQSLSPEHAMLFSEPVVAADGTMDWYGAGNGMARSLDELSETEREKAVSRFQKLHSEVRAHAEELLQSKNSTNQRMGAIIESALSFSRQGDQPLPLLVVGDQPVLVNWGTKLDSDLAPPDPLEDFVNAVRDRLPRKPVPAAPAQPETPPSPRLPLAPLQPSTRLTLVSPRSWLAWLVWALFALLLLLLFAILLAPCGVAGLTGTRFCPTTTLTRPMADASVQGLLAEVAGLEDALARAPLCEVPEPEPVPEPAPIPEPEPVPEPESELSEADRRREEAGGQLGELTITLTWNNYTDLDLHLYCSGGGHISYQNRNACGGQLDVDRNESAGGTTRPVENIYFSQLPSGSQFTVRVHNYAERGGIWNSTSYRVEVSMGGERKVYTGSLRNGEWGQNITIQVP